MNFSSRSAAETKKIAGEIALTLLAARPRGARVLALTGDLGAGKTTFVQGLLRALGIKSKVLSPTFILMQSFKVLTFKGRQASVSRFWHIDCYRIDHPQELKILGLAAILKDPHALVVVEWAEKIKEILPNDAIWIQFEYGKRENERAITVKLKNQNAKIKTSTQKSKVLSFQL
jgi:tRNA threonylcarbamoyladenosine biosynthesis protein TsaE